MGIAGKKREHRKKQHKQLMDEPIQWFYLLPLALIIALVPLIVRLKIVPLDQELTAFWTSNTNYDFFSYYKMVWLLLATLVQGGIFLYLLAKNRLTLVKTRLYIPMAIYCACVILSALFATYKQVALIGYPDRYEGLLAQLCYVGILFLTINLVKHKSHVKFLLGALLTSAAITGAICTAQFWGYDLFATSFGKRLIIPGAHAQLRESVKFSFPESRVYGTFFNPNYVGSYIALLFPPVFILAFSRSLKWYHRACLAGITGLLLIGLLGSQSRAGLFSLLGAAVFLLLLFRKVLWRHKVLFLLVVVLTGGIVYQTNQKMEGLLWNRMVSAVKNLSPEPGRRLEDIRLNGNQVSLVMSDATILVNIAETGQVTFSNEEGTLLEPVEEGTVVRFTEAPYQSYSFEFNYLDNPRLFRLQWLNIIFYISDEGIQFVNERGKPVLLEAIPHVGFEGREAFASKRGYIWSRSIPLLKNTPIIGYGSDTFALHFPQHDYIGKYQAMGTIATIVDKPHNLYLQIGIQTGLLSLLAYGAILILILYRSGKTYFFADFTGLPELAGGGMLIALIAYLLASLFNDSVVSVAPIAWFYLGMVFILPTIHDRPPEF